MRINLIDSNSKKKQGFIYSEDDGAYFVGTNVKPIAKMLLNKEEYTEHRLKTLDFETPMKASLKESGRDVVRPLSLSNKLDNSDLISSDFEGAVLTVNEEAENVLPLGVYRICTIDYRTMYKPFPLNPKKNTVKYIDILSPIEGFFANPNPNRPRLGILLYGMQGCGKSVAIREVCDLPNTYTFYVSPNIALSELLDAREVLKGQNVVFIFEEITATLDERALKEYLGFLDGEYSWDNCVTLATTNNPEELPANLVDRPGRLELFYEFKAPNVDEIDDLAKLFNYDGDLSFIKGKDLSWDYCSFLLNKAVKDNKDLKTIHDDETTKRKHLSKTFKGKLGL